MWGTLRIILLVVVLDLIGLLAACFVHVKHEATFGVEQNEHATPHDAKTNNEARPR